METFRHIVFSEGSYLRRLAGSAPSWVDSSGQPDLDDFRARADELGSHWDDYLAPFVDPEKVYLVDAGAYGVRAGVIVAQVLHHGNAHREQICSILTSLGIEAPDIQPWEYAWAAKRIWEARQI